MKKEFIKYAQVLLKKGLNIKKGQPLLILAPVDAIEFIRVLSEEAYKMGVNDIYFDFEDEMLKYYQLQYLDENALEKSGFWYKPIWDEYAKKDAAFLMLTSVVPGLMDNIDSNKITTTGLVFRESRKVYKERQLKYEIPWTIACVSTPLWAEKLFPNEKNATEKLWNTLFKMCLVDKEDPLKEWDEKIKFSNKVCKKLNEMQFKKLHYKNGLGTDLTIELPLNHIWEGTKSNLPDGREILVNIPSEEVFTSPLRTGTNGIVYNSKPLVYNGKKIDGFWIKFKNGEATEWFSKEGEEVLKSIITTDKTSNMLGEVALVNYDSPISNSNIIFYETLYDENASCHIALGSGFRTCIKDGLNMSTEELMENGVNESLIHVDFMIGTSDLNITGVTKDDVEVEIFKNGNFII